MKLVSACIVLVVIFSVDCFPSISPEQLQKLIGYSKACREKTGATVEMVTKAIAGEFVDDPKLKAQLFCISTKIGFQSEDGEIKKDVLNAKLDTIIHNPKETEELVNTCAVPKATPEETAYDSIKCYFDKRGINLIG